MRRRSSRVPGTLRAARNDPIGPCHYVGRCREHTMTTVNYSDYSESSRLRQRLRPPPRLRPAGSGGRSGGSTSTPGSSPSRSSSSCRSPGLVILYTQPIENLFEGDIRTVDRGAEIVSFDEQAAAVEAAYPDGTVLDLTPPADPGRSSRFFVDDGSANGAARVRRPVHRRGARRRPSPAAGSSGCRTACTATSTTTRSRCRCRQSLRCGTADR